MSLRDLPKAFVNRKVNTKKQNVDWLRIRWIRVSKDEPLQFRYRYSHNPLEQWKVVDLKRRTKGRPPDMGHIVPKKLYMSPRSIKSAKKDLLELLNFVPPIYHAFYQDLVSEGTEDDEDESEHEDSESEENEPSDQEDND